MEEAERGAEAVEKFTRSMMRELDANRWKGHWLLQITTRRAHFHELDYHLAKLKAAIRAEDDVRVLEYAADLANHAMFLTDDECILTEFNIAKRKAEASFVKPKRRVYAWLAINPRWWKKAWGGWRHPVEYEEHEDGKRTEDAWEPEVGAPEYDGLPDYNPRERAYVEKQHYPDWYA